MTNLAKLPVSSNGYDLVLDSVPVSASSFAFNTLPLCSTLHPAQKNQASDPSFPKHSAAWLGTGSLIDKATFLPFAVEFGRGCDGLQRSRLENMALE